MENQIFDFGLVQATSVEDVPVREIGKVGHVLPTAGKPRFVVRIGKSVVTGYFDELYIVQDECKYGDHPFIARASTRAQSCPHGRCKVTASEHRKILRESDQESQIARVAEFVCNACGVECSSLSSLAAHKRRHNGEFPTN